MWWYWDGWPMIYTSREWWRPWEFWPLSCEVVRIDFPRLPDVFGDGLLYAPRYCINPVPLLSVVLLEQYRHAIEPELLLTFWLLAYVLWARFGDCQRAMAWRSASPRGMRWKCTPSCAEKGPRGCRLLPGPGRGLRTELQGPRLRPSDAFVEPGGGGCYSAGMPDRSFPH